MTPSKIAAVKQRAEEEKARARRAISNRVGDGWPEEAVELADIIISLASDVLSLLAERDAAYRNGKRSGLISAAEYLEHEATLTEANRDRATDEEHRRAYTVQAGIYRSAALVCRSRAAVAASEAEDEIAKLRAEIDALKPGVYLWQFY